jgi:hypothetical protein
MAPLPPFSPIPQTKRLIPPAHLLILLPTPDSCSFVFICGQFIPPSLSRKHIK